MTDAPFSRSSRDKVRLHRQRLRDQGLRLVQVWAPDVTSPAFLAEAHRQSRMIAESAGEADDHLEDVRAGRLTDLAHRVVEYLAYRGETQKKRMRADLGIESKEGRGDLERAIEELQRLMYVARVKAVGERSDDYNYTYDLFVRRYPETVKAAEGLSSADATLILLRRLLELAGGVTEKQVSRLFDWENARTARAVDALESTGGVRRVDTLLVLPRYDTQA